MSVGYAFRSEWADTARLCIIEADSDWNYWSNPPHMHSIPSGNVGIGTNNPSAKLDAYTTSGTAVRGISEDGAGSKRGGRFSAMVDGYDNIGVLAEAGCYGLGCTPGSNSNIGIWAISSTGPAYSVPSGNWAGYFNGDVKTVGDLELSGDARVDGRINNAVFNSGAAHNEGYQVAVKMAGNNMDQGEVHFGLTLMDQWVDIWLIYSNSYLMGNFVKYGGTATTTGHFRLSSSGVIEYSSSTAGASAGYAYWDYTNKEVRIYESNASNDYCEWWSYDRRQ